MSNAQLFARALLLAVAFIVVASLAAYAGKARSGPRTSAPVCCIYMIF